jgi:hypothetical protein
MNCLSTPGKEMKRYLFKGVLAYGIVVLFLGTAIIPGLGQINGIDDKQKNTDSVPIPITEKTSLISLTVFGKTSLEKHDIVVSSDDAKEIYRLFNEVKQEMIANPFSQHTQQVQQEFAGMLERKGVLPAGMSTQELTALLQQPVNPPSHPRLNIAPFQNKASERLCTFFSTGTGAAFPVIVLPRLIPILLTPIPRVILRWSAKDGVTSCGGLRSGTGYIAYGEQKGVTLGFWGVGITFSFPPVMNTYGLLGYALYAGVQADYIEHFPPNNPPEITQTDPTDGQEMVPLSTHELRFNIDDADSDLMSYTVNTTPDIGSGSGGLKTNGVYTIPVSGLESLTQYSWTIQVTDGKDTTEKTLSFITEPVAPVITNPVPGNGERDVPMDITQLKFTLKDYQSDPMDYTVQTSPNIGSGHSTGVHDGTYSIPVSGLTYGAEYHWFLNVTDGTHWTRKTFSFETGYPSQFNPFSFGWQYRKQITINHTQVTGDLQEFPILLSATDADLIKARTNGEDLLFMNNVGVASKLYHDIDVFDESTGQLVAWVKIPSLSSTTDTIIYLYYGNPASLSMTYPEKVWEGKYNAVYHLSGEPTEPVHDSTGNTNTGVAQGTMTSSDLVEGKLGTAYSFDGTDDFISFADFTNGLQKGACSAWVQTTADDAMMVWAEGASSSTKPYIALGKAAGGELSFARDVYGTNSNFQGRKDVGMNDGVWHYIVWSSTGSLNRFFFDGSEITMTWQDGQNPNGIWFDDQNTDTTSLGLLNRANPDNPWDGLLDELHITNSPLSADWVATEYANQNSPAWFASIGPEVPGP